jgi:hypothetical protein
MTPLLLPFLSKKIRHRSLATHCIVHRAFQNRYFLLYEENIILISLSDRKTNLSPCILKEVILFISIKSVIYVALFWRKNTVF